MKNSDSIKYLTNEVLKFRDERDWKKYHTPKNLASAINVEAGELLDFYTWSEEPRNIGKPAEEAADILYHLLLFAHEAGIDLGEEFLKKLKLNEIKYPADKVRGSHKKYSEYV